MGSDTAMTDASFGCGCKETDVRTVGAELYLLPVTTRMPLKFGSETLTTVTYARVKLTVKGRDGREADGWGETPLSVQWTWPGELSFQERQDAMVEFCKRLAAAWAGCGFMGPFTGKWLPVPTRDFARARGRFQSRSPAGCTNALSSGTDKLFAVRHCFARRLRPASCYADV